MKRQEATECATEVTTSWRNGLATHVWEEEFQQNYGDFERAMRAIRKMRRTCKFAPVIADFHAMYLATPESNPGHEETKCGDCGNDGWVEAAPETHNGNEYTAVKPCPHCRHGRKAEHSSTWKARSTEHQPAITDHGAAA